MLDDAIGSTSFTISIGNDPLGSNASAVTRSVIILPMFADGNVCCYVAGTTGFYISLDRMLAHEIGYLTGTRDDGPERMNNIRRWENPIMNEIAPTQPNRTSYGIPRRTKVR